MNECKVMVVLERGGRPLPTPPTSTPRSYAADGYARATGGPSALVCTFSVGGLSALNAVAGAYAGARVVWCAAGGGLRLGCSGCRPCGGAEEPAPHPAAASCTLH